MQEQLACMNLKNEVTLNTEIDWYALSMNLKREILKGKLPQMEGTRGTTINTNPFCWKTIFFKLCIHNHLFLWWKKIILRFIS